MARVSTDGINWVECNGQGLVNLHYDDVEIQAALDSLPETGGTIYLGAGTFTLAKQIARAIDNVTIRGEGLLTHIDFNDSTAVISAGSQSGWRLEYFDTDQGWVDIASASDSSAVCWKDGVGVEGGGSSYPHVCVTALFTESAGAATYTAEIPIPAGATVLDVRWNNEAVWAAATSATLNVGDSDDADGYIDGVDVKSAPIADVNGAGGISSFLGDTGAGAYKSLTKYYAVADAVIATVVTVGATGATGISRLTVVYVVGPLLTATKVLTT